jgi:hypothetical protein
MNKRSFLQGLLAALGGGIASSASAAPRRRVLIQRSPLSGFQYHAGKELWPRLAVGQPLALVREPANPHDERAVRIDWRGHKLGYLPRIDNAAVAQMLDRGERIEARIAELRDSQDPWERVVVVAELRI